MDARQLAAARTGRFLEACGASGNERADALERAGTIAEASGTALLRIRCGPDEAVLEVDAPNGAAPEARALALPA